MRKAFCDSLMSHADVGQFVFLTGDLGFRALEPLQTAMGMRFINAGVAEQNMVSVAAGMARHGLRPWTYSIAPFMYARPFEQIRNDVCLHGFPVVMVGNGGGYGYGVMGGTHHAIEDYGTLLTLSGMRAFLPAFDTDVPHVVNQLMDITGPAYLRLGLSEEPRGWSPPKFEAWRKLVSGRQATLISVGPLAGSMWQACCELPEVERPHLWCLSQLPLSALPPELLADIRDSDVLCVAEEHVAHGGAGESLAVQLVRQGCVPRRFIQRTALGYPSKRYGSQKFHRRECELDPHALLEAIRCEGTP